MGRWAKSHDQRKGQWLVNAIRFPSEGICLDAKDVQRILFNMTNEDFDMIMEKYWE